MIKNDLNWFSDWWKQVESLRRRPWTAALLLAPPGLQVGSFAREIAGSLLCQRPMSSGEACGQCPSCGWVQQAQHPDLRWVRPDAEREADGEAMDAEASDEGAEAEGTSDTKASREIRISQIRGLLGFSQISSHRGAERLAVIGPIERLNVESANALLKGLEEPPPGMRFLLYGESLMGVPATILSRCRRLRLTAPPALIAAHRAGVAEVAQSLLPQLRQGRLDPLAWAGLVEKMPPDQLIQFLVLWLTDLQFACRGLPACHFATEQASLDAMARTCRASGAEALQQLSLGQQALLGRMRTAGHPLNPRLHVESILADFARAFERESHHA